MYLSVAAVQCCDRQPRGKSPRRRCCLFKLARAYSLDAHDDALLVRASFVLRKIYRSVYRLSLIYTFACDALLDASLEE